MWIRSRTVFAAPLALILSLIPVSPSLATAITAGDILVADLGTCGQDGCVPGTGTIRQYSASGGDLGVFADGLSTPWSITADQLGYIYVSERDGHIKKFSPAGDNIPLLTITTAFTPGGVRVADGTIYVVDSSGGKINRYSATDGTDLGVFASTGFVSADFMAFDAQGNLYVTGKDASNDEFVRRVFSQTGANLGDFVAGFSDLTGITFDAHDNLYVASFTSNIVERYFLPPSPPGTELEPFPFAQGDTGNDSFRGIAFDASGNLYVANSARGNVLQFLPAGGTPQTPPFASGLSSPWDLVIVPVIIPPVPSNPTIKTECKEDDGWQSFDFKNQGDCIQFVNTGK
jgi:sugar lactone lactonase YvrE